VTSYREHFVRFARYNAWANVRLYDACAALPEADYHAVRASAFFGSLHGTLNHILVGDRAWMRRMTGEGDAPDRLDAELYRTLAELRTARAAEDDRIRSFVEGLDESGLARTVSYHSMTGGADARPLAELLSHLFNHHTHHRGQAHALLKETGAEPPPLDMIYYLREVG
jgi:uncharacterized damage-inducible protein DinB